MGSSIHRFDMPAACALSSSAPISSKIFGKAEFGVSSGRAPRRPTSTRGERRRRWSRSLSSDSPIPRLRPKLQSTPPPGVIRPDTCLPSSFPVTESRNEAEAETIVDHGDSDRTRELSAGR